MSKVRCAIYTRKSSEEGLEQDFNSLDAQREACAAYILSQASEGWSQLPDRYDDGGISGGTLERPALQRLLSDIRDGKIDIVVVYKVDRLTRSLLDFARLVEAMDAAKVSFVSITQSFNTTTSMGRLTLNMLLSFAQFEREVTAERIRDKIAASKAKGMWMGGVVPLGYLANGRTLTIDDEHAPLIRSIFARYLQVGNVRILTQQMMGEGSKVPLRVTRSGRTLGGSAFTRGQLYKILGNPIYRGKISHKGVLHEGQHDPIIDEATWVAVQRRLAANVQGQQQAQGSRSPSLLSGKIVDELGQALVASHATKGTRRYRYYVGKPVPADAVSAGPLLRIPALELEKVVCDALAHEIARPLTLLGQANVQITATSMAALSHRASELATRIGKRERSAVRQCIDIVRVAAEHITLELSASALAQCLGIEPASGDSINPVITIDAALKRSGRAMRLIQDGQARTSAGQPQEHLLKLLHRARSWWQDMTERKLTISALAREQRVTSSYASRVVRLNFLAPLVVETIASGDQPPGLDAKTLLGLRDLPLCWDAQAALLLGR